MSFLEFLGALWETFISVLKGPGLFVLSLWWLWLPIPAVIYAWRMWLRYARLWYYWVRETWILLEVRVPKEILKTPKAMEQIFSGVWSMITKGNLYERLWSGRWIDYMTFELLGTAGETHFFVCLPERYRPMIESYVYSEYPEAEIQQVQDYFDRLPSELPAEGWRIMGSELAFTSSDPYPIRTYLQFEDPTDERRIDPMSHFAELFNKLRDGEYVIYQLVVRPSDDEWKNKSWALIDKLIGKVLPESPEAPELKESRAWLRDTAAYLNQFFFGGEVVVPAEEETNQRDVGTSKMLHLSPGQRATVEAIGLKTGKHGLEVNFRMVYVGREELFRAKAVVSSMFGAIGLFGGDLNGFRPLNATKTWVDYFRKRREPKRERRLWKEFRKRYLIDPLFATFFSNRKYYGRPSGVLLMNIEELASIYHFPITEVVAPLLPRIEAKKGEPPVGLPVG